MFAGALVQEKNLPRSIGRVLRLANKGAWAEVRWDCSDAVSWVRSTSLNILQKHPNRRPEPQGPPLPRRKKGKCRSTSSAVKELLRVSGLDVETLRHKGGIAPNQWSLWSRGETSIKLFTLQQFAKRAGLQLVVKFVRIDD